MLVIFDMAVPLEPLARLGLAMLAGAVIGLEREIRAEHAGFRTMMLVCVGSALVMTISTELAHVQWPAQIAEDNRINVDPGRIAYGIMTGIGFLGAGTIIERRGRASGLTTAAAIWCVAAIGMAIGFGLYFAAMVTTALVLAALWLLDHLEGIIPQRRVREVTLRTRYQPNILTLTVKRLTRPGLRVEGIAMHRNCDNDLADVSLRLAFHVTRTRLPPREEELSAGGDYQVIAMEDG